MCAKRWKRTVCLPVYNDLSLESNLLIVVNCIEDFLLRYVKLYSLNHIDHIDHRALRDHLADFLVNYPESKIKIDTWTDDTDLVSVLTNHLPKRDRFTGWLLDFIYWMIHGPLSDMFFKVSGVFSLINLTLFTDTVVG